MNLNLSTSQKRALREKLQREEKKFLMQHYAQLLVERLEESDQDDLDDRTAESLLVARPYVGSDLAARIASLLAAGNYEVEDEEAADELFPLDSGEEDTLEEIGASLEGEDQVLSEGGEDQAQDLFADEAPAESTEAPFAAEDEQSDGEEELVLQEEEEVTEDQELFEEEEEEEASPDNGSSRRVEQEKEDLRRAAAELFADEEEEPLESEAEESGQVEEESESEAEREEEEDEEAGVLFDRDIYSGNKGRRADLEDSEEDSESAEELPAQEPPSPPARGRARKETGLKPAKGHEVEEIPGATPTKGRQAKKTSGFTPTKERQAKETPGFTPTKGHDVQETPGFTPTKGHDVQETPGFKPAKERQAKETPGFTPTKGHEIEETPGFTPTKGHDVQETPGFKPAKGHQAKETPGFTPTKGHDVQETPGFTPTKGHDVQETPGFTPTKGHEIEETPGFTPTKGHQAKETPGFTPPETSAAGEETEQDRPDEEGSQPQESPAGQGPELESPRDRAKRRQAASERAAKAREELERRKKAREEQRQAQEEEEEEQKTEDTAIDDLFDFLDYQVSLEDLERYLNLKIIPDERARLERLLVRKMSEPCIRSLLENAQSQDISLALIPRLGRFLRDGQMLKVTGANLVRNYPQLFDNVQQLVIKFRTEASFMQQVPDLDWALVTCEVLPDSRDKHYMQQKLVLKQHAHQHQVTEHRVRRRNLVDAMYDLVVVQLVLKETMLSATVDLTESRVGRQNHVFINYGEHGIRISDISRQQAHPQMGVCANW